MEAGFLLGGCGRVGGGELLLAQEGHVVLLKGVGRGGGGRVGGMHVAARANATAAAAHGRYGFALCCGVKRFAVAGVWEEEGKYEVWVCCLLLVCVGRVGGECGRGKEKRKGGWKDRRASRVNEKAREAWNIKVSHTLKEGRAPLRVAK